MLSIFKKNPIKKLNKEYTSLLEQALEAQRRGDIRSYSELTAEAEKLALKIDEVKLNQ